MDFTPPIVLKNWFDEALILKKRGEIKSLILGLKNKKQHQTDKIVFDSNQLVESKIGEDNEDIEVKKIIDPQEPKTTTLINDEPTKIVKTDLRLSTSPLSDSSSTFCSNELVINGDDPNHLYDNKKNISLSYVTKPDCNDDEEREKTKSFEAAEETFILPTCEEQQLKLKKRSRDDDQSDNGNNKKQRQTYENVSEEISSNNLIILFHNFFF